MSRTVRPRHPALAEPGYRVPPRPQPIDLDLRGNEGAIADSSLLTAVLDKARLLRSYPDRTAVATALARRHGLPADHVLVTAGADGALDRICRAMLRPGDRAVWTTPGFDMTRRYVGLARAEAVGVPWSAGPFPVADVLAAAETAQLVVLTSPNNPTGAAATPADVAAVAEGVPDGVLVVVDAAYEAFADAPLSEVALRYDNVVLVRTLSKSWGLAGLRVGWVAARDARWIGWLHAAGSPYTVSGPSLAIAEAALRLATSDASGPAGQPAWVPPFVDQVRRARADLAAAGSAAGLSTVPSQANFVFARGPHTAWVADALAGLGIGVRTFPELAGLEDAVRIACPATASQTRRVTTALAVATRPEALLFDMDGVLVDVSGSYRAAIVATCAHFGVPVTPADIAEAKAAGHANNDWVLSRRLLGRAGVEVSLAQVTDTFEAAYQGTSEQPGLYTHERLRVEPAWLRAWSRRLPLAVVTGRPRRDAERLLHDFDLADCFSAVVCMEDAPAKPSPAPVRQALLELGVQRAWMVGDTPDDLVAARAAGVVPLGVCAPGEAATDRLLAAGAARVLSTPSALDALLLPLLPPARPPESP